MFADKVFENYIVSDTFDEWNIYGFSYILSSWNKIKICYLILCFSYFLYVCKMICQTWWRNGWIFSFWKTFNWISFEWIYCIECHLFMLTKIMICLLILHTYLCIIILSCFWHLFIFYIFIGRKLHAADHLLLISAKCLIFKSFTYASIFHIYIYVYFGCGENSFVVCQIHHKSDFMKTKTKKYAPERYKSQWQKLFYYNPSQQTWSTA